MTRERLRCKDDVIRHGVEDEACERFGGQWLHKSYPDHLASFGFANAPLKIALCPFRVGKFFGSVISVVAIAERTNSTLPIGRARPDLSSSLYVDNPLKLQFTVGMSLNKHDKLTARVSADETFCRTTSDGNGMGDMIGIKPSGGRTHRAYPNAL